MPALALGVEPTPQDIMERKPNDAKKSLFADGMIFNIAIEGCFIGALSFLAFTIGRVFFDNGGEPVVGRTMTFASLSLCQLIHAFNIKSEQSIFKGGLFTNPKLILSFIIGVIMQVSVISIPALATIFKAVPLSPIQWLIVAGSTAHRLWYSNSFDINLYLAFLFSSLPHTAIYAVSNVIFLMLMYKPIGSKLKRAEQRIFA